MTTSIINIDDKEITSIMTKRIISKLKMNNDNIYNINPIYNSFHGKNEGNKLNQISFLFPSVPKEVRLSILI